MAVGVQLDCKGATLDQYDQVAQKMGYRPGGPSVPGNLFHWVTETPDGIRVIDVWQSREAFEKYSEEKIVPFTREVGFPAPPGDPVLRGTQLPDCWLMPLGTHRYRRAVRARAEDRSGGHRPTGR